MVNSWRVRNDNIASSDASTFYSFYSYGIDPSPSMFYTAFSTSTGSVIGSRYKSTSTINFIYNLALSSDYLICETNTMLIIYKISTSNFKIKYYPSYYFGWSYNLSLNQ